MKIFWRILGATFLLLLVFAIVFYLNPIWAADQWLGVKLWRQGVHGSYVNAGGYRVHYLEATAPAGGSGTPLVLIHGLGSRAEDWAPLIPQLAANGFHVYALDLLGFGSSPKPDVDYSITTQETLVVQFMQALNIPEADVGGWSMGGWVAAKLALDHPGLVNRLILYDSAGIYFPATFEGSLFTPHDDAGLVHLTEMLDAHPPKLPEFVVKAAIRRLQSNAWVIDRSVASMTIGRDLLDFRLSRIRVPTLVVWGSRDILIPLNIGISMHHLIPNSSMTVVEGCGHVASGQCWRSTVKTTVEFLRADPPIKGVEQTLPGY